MIADYNIFQIMILISFKLNFHILGVTTPEAGLQSWQTHALVKWQCICVILPGQAQMSKVEKTLRSLSASGCTVSLSGSWGTPFTDEFVQLFHLCFRRFERGVWGASFGASSYERVNACQNSLVKTELCIGDHGGTISERMFSISRKTAPPNHVFRVSS